MAYITDEQGNYKRTVRCGHCYEKEHNKSSCPQRKQDLKDNVERYTKELAENKFVHDYQRTNTERYLANNKQQLHKMETRGQNRKCGYCSEPGHTRRTCPHRKEKVDEQMTKTLDLRSRVAERMISDNFGPGALVQLADDRLAVITHVDFERIVPNHAVTRDSYFNAARLLTYQYLVPVEDSWGGRPKTAGSCYVPLHYMNIDDIPEKEWYRDPHNSSCVLLSGVEISEDALVSAASVDKKLVEKFVISEIVDPK